MPAMNRSRTLLSAFFVQAGVNHFIMPRTYESIVPPSMQDDAARLVAISGVAEIAGGIGVLLPRTRRLAGLGLIALLAAVFPANLYMAREPRPLPPNSALGTVCAVAAAASDDALGLARDAVVSPPAPEIGP